MKRNLLKYMEVVPHPHSPKEILLIQPQIQRNCESFQKPDILEVACQINFLSRGYAAKVYHLSKPNWAKINIFYVKVKSNVRVNVKVRVDMRQYHIICLKQTGPKFS